MLDEREIKEIAERAGMDITFDPSKTDFIDGHGNDFADYDPSAFRSKDS